MEKFEYDWLLEDTKKIPEFFLGVIMTLRLWKKMLILWRYVQVS